MTKHCSFSTISESRAGSSKKSKSRYDCLPRSRAAILTSDVRRGVFERQRRERERRVGRERYVGRSFGNVRFLIVYINCRVPVLGPWKSAPHNGYSFQLKA